LFQVSYLSYAPVWRSPSTRCWTSQAPTTRILLVDDDPSLRSLIRILLSSSGYEVVTAVNGEDALDRLDEAEFSLILLDLEMPVMNGREFFEQLRARGDETPVVIVSAYGADAARRELGAQAALNKPFDPHRAVLLVKDILGQS
jgi:CheY-like chemotaxis protein